MGSHPNYVEGYDGTHLQLAEAIIKMDYDSVSKVVSYIAMGIKRQGDEDFLRGRDELAERLYSSSRSLDEAAENLRHVWELCAPRTEVLTREMAELKHLKSESQ